MATCRLTTTRPKRAGTMAELKDPLYDDAVRLVRYENRASPAFLQREFLIGYNRAARLIDAMEENGVITKANYKGERKVVCCE